MLRNTLSLLAVAAVAGCGGSGTEPNAFAFDDPNDGLASILAITVSASGQTATPFADLPTTGTTNYQGLAAIGWDNGVEDGASLGTFDIDANFATNTLSGSVDDLVGIEPTGMGTQVASTGDIGGSLAISGGQIMDDGGDAAFTASIAGDLVDGTTMIGIDSMIEGGFAGPTAGIIVAQEVSGATAEVVTESNGAAVQDLSIVLLGEAQ